MLIQVEENDSDSSTVAAINDLHAPAVGTVVVHAPYGCPLREFAIEVLVALGRPPDLDEPAANLTTWAAAWLRTARPRCDLLIYGARRLAASCYTWLRALAEHPQVTVWLIDDPNELQRSTPPAVGATPIWSWQTFITRPWRRERLRDYAAEALCGKPCPPGWPRAGLPPFPWTRGRIAEFATGSPEYAAVLQLTLTYEALSPVIERAIGTPRLEARGVMAAVAYLALIADSAADLSVLVRHLEEDVFIRRGLLIVDPHRISQRIAELRADRLLDDAHQDPTMLVHSADPMNAVSHLIGDLRPQDRREFEESEMVSAADDGSTLINGHGTTVHVPPWWSWCVRAAATMQPTQSRYTPPTTPQTAVLTEVSRLTSYRAVTVLGSHDSQQLHATLGATIDAIAPDITFEPLPESGGDPVFSAHEQTSQDGIDQPLTVAAAHRLHELYEQRSERLYRHVHLPPGDSGIAWLTTHGLAEHHAERGNTTIVPWLHEAMRARLRRPFNAEDHLPRRFV